MERARARLVAKHIMHTNERASQKLTFLSFLYHVKVANGLPPDDIQTNFWTDPAGIIEPST